MVLWLFVVNGSTKKSTNKKTTCVLNAVMDSFPEAFVCQIMLMKATLKPSVKMACCKFTCPNSRARKKKFAQLRLEIN